MEGIVNDQLPKDSIPDDPIFTKTRGTKWEHTYINDEKLRSAMVVLSPPCWQYICVLGRSAPVFWLCWIHEREEEAGDGEEGLKHSPIS